MGIPGPHFPGEMGTPTGKWGPLLSDFRECPVKPHLDLSHRYLSMKCIKWNNPEAVLSVQIQNGNDNQAEQERFIYIAIRYTLLSSRWPLMITAKYYRPGLTHDVKEYISCLVNKVYIATAVAVLW